MRQIFLNFCSSKRSLLFVLVALLYSTQSRLEAQNCDPDVTNPVAVCDEFTAVSLNTNGSATVMAATFDDGSYDACCSNLVFKVKKHVDGPCDGDSAPDDFEDTVTFCCGENSLVVTMRVIDCAGNFQDCQITVDVEDKIKPVCVAPANVTLSCENFDPTLESYPTHTSTDNCCIGSVETIINDSQFDTLCSRGTILRTFKVFDCSGNSSQCIQQIVVNNVQNYFVRFPNDLIVSALDPNGVYGEPTFFGEDCELMASGYTDAVFTTDPTASLRIERTWQIINWCTFDPQLPPSQVPNPNPNAIVNHPQNLPGPIVSAPGTQGPWASTISKIDPLDPSPTDFSSFWQQNVNMYEYRQIIRLVDTFFISIQGTVFSDTSANCTYEAGEQKLEGWTVKATGLTTGTVKEVLTDANGAYTVLMNGLDTIVTVTVENANNIGQGCPTSFDVEGILGQTVTQDIPVQLENRCALLSVGITAPLLRRCFQNRYTAQACNLSGNDVSNAYVEIALDGYLNYTQSSVPGTLVSGNTYRFDLGDLAAGDCRRFWVEVNLSCDAPLGYTHCTEAKVYPVDDCSTNNAWTGSDVKSLAVCDGDSVRLILTNVGTGNMANQLDFVVVEDIIMRQEGNFQLGVGQSKTISFPANGSTWRLESYEESTHPFGGVQAAALEGCGGLNLTGLVNLFPMNDNNPFDATDCQENRGSFDPNDKQGFPFGIGNEHFIKSNTSLEYLIRFQNTGTDTAFTVKVLDTLSQHLNPATVRVLATSHPAAFTILEGNVLQFLFSNILLPDSNVNYEASNGFLRFQVEQMPDNPEGIRIDNSAAIYFDFNEPVITNTTFHTINNHALSVGIDEIFNGKSVKVFPNPTADVATFEFETLIQNGQFELRNQLGQLARTEQFSGYQFRFQRAGLQPGIYFFTIIEQSGVAYSGKILVK